MDPNAALSAMRRAEQAFDEAAVREGQAAPHVRAHPLVKDPAAEEEQAAHEDVLDAAQGLRDGFEALDRWLTTGGFLPHAWEPAQRLDGVRLARLVAHGLRVAGLTNDRHQVLDRSANLVNVDQAAARIAQVIAAVDTMERVQGRFAREGTDFDVDEAIRQFRENAGHED